MLALGVLGIAPKGAAEDWKVSGLRYFSLEDSLDVLADGRDDTGWLRPPMRFASSQRDLARPATSGLAAPASDLVIDDTTYNYPGGTASYTNIIVGQSGSGTLNLGSGSLTATDTTYLGQNDYGYGTVTKRPGHFHPDRRHL